MSPILGGRWRSGGVRCPPATPEPPSLKAVHPQVPGGGGEWTTSLLSPREADATAEGPIPCRRMRSGSYIKAMGDEDSDESGGSPKPSPKTAARRQSYLRATQQSLGEQSNPRR